METKFPFIPATTLSMKRRRLSFGVAFNDAEYIIKPYVEGVQIECPYFRVWRTMLQRCYGGHAYHNKNPTYRGCTVCHEWLTFSNFRAWMVTQDWKGKQIDKDILCKGNKIYSPELCVFVTKYTNTLFTGSNRSDKGDLPAGVHRQNTKFVSQCHNGMGQQQYLGIYKTVREAECAYLYFKIQVVEYVANKQDDPRVEAALLSMAGDLQDRLLSTDNF